MRPTSRQRLRTLAVIVNPFAWRDAWRGLNGPY
jgi:hypothetical protein